MIRARDRLPRVSLRTVILLTVAVVAALQVVPRLLGSAPSGPATNREIDAYLAGQLADAGFPGAAVAIVRDGHLEHATAFGVADRTGRLVATDTPFVIGSLSKGLTAIAVLRLLDAGAIDLDAPASQYLPTFRTADQAASASITVRHLLNQMSGLPASAVDLSAPVTTLDGQVDRFTTVSLASVPGTRYEYANANYVVLGALVQRVTGRPYAEAMDELVFGPLGMSRTTADLDDAQRNGLGDAHRLWFGLSDSHAPLFRPDVLPAGFITSTATDLARVNEMILANGRVDGTAFLSPAAFSALTTGVVSAGPTGGRYAMGWIETTIAGEPALVHDGSTTDESAVQVVMPGRGLAIVLLTNGQSVLYELFQKTTTIGHAAAARLAGLPATGTLEAFYPVFDLAVVALMAVMVRSFLRAVAAARRGTEQPLQPSRARTIGVRILRLYLDWLVPLAILWRTPAFLAAPWWILVRLDVGLVLFLFALVRLATGVVRLVGWARLRRANGLQSNAAAVS
jgi:CubicO group peptidase (beta-lactamase class C family)